MPVRSSSRWHAAARAVCGVMVGLSSVSALWAGTSNSLMDISADGQLLACSNRDSGSLTVVELATQRVLHEVAVGHKPEGISFLGSSHALAVAVYADDKVVFVDGDAGNVTGEVAVFDEPYGIVSSADGDRVYVTLDYPGRVVEIDCTTRSVVRELEAGKFLRGIAISLADQRVYVTEYYTGTVKALELPSGQVLQEWPGAKSDNLARQITLHPHRPKAYLPHIRSSITRTIGEGSIFPYVTVLDRQGDRRKKIPMDSFISVLVTSNPWEVAVTPDGKQLFVVFAGTDDMFACHVEDDDYRELTPRDHVKLGSNPRAVRVSPAGDRFYVYNALDFEVVAYDTETLRAVATIAVCDNPLGDELLLGKRLFYSAQMPMASRRWISCSSCHPDGDPDGRTWHNPEGLRNTQSLAGMAWTHPIHWSADRDEVQDFEFTIRGPLMQGRGLISNSRPNAELGEPNKGRSAELDALAAYSNSHKFSLSPHSRGGLSPAALRGRDLFLAEETGCSKCHAGPLFSDSRPDRPIKHNVGTGEDDAGEKLGPEFDTPTLLGVYRTAPYLHHGRAESLLDVLTLNKHDRHGKTSQLSSDQLSDLVEFLRGLPYEDPEPAAVQAGVRRIER